MFKNRYNLIILVLGLVFVLGGCVKKDSKIEVENDKQPAVVNNQQTTDQSTNVDNSKVENNEIDTSDWLTYRNEEYGFEFKYPNTYKNFTAIKIEHSKDDKINSGQSLLAYSDNGGIKFHFYSKDYTSYHDEFVYHGDKNLNNWCKSNLQIDDNYESVVISNSVGFCNNVKINNENTFYDIKMTYLPECGLGMSQSAYLNLKNLKYSGLVISSPLAKKLEHFYDCSGDNSQLEKEVKQYFKNIINKNQIDEITKKEIEEFQFIISTFKMID